MIVFLQRCFQCRWNLFHSQELREIIKRGLWNTKHLREFKDMVLHLLHPSVCLLSRDGNQATANTGITYRASWWPLPPFSGCLRHLVASSSLPPQNYSLLLDEVLCGLTQRSPKYQWGNSCPSTQTCRTSAEPTLLDHTITCTASTSLVRQPHPACSSAFSTTIQTVFPSWELCLWASVKPKSGPTVSFSSTLANFILSSAELYTAQLWQ